MANIGQNAEFVNIGGNSNGETGNVLIDTLSNIPTLMKKLNVENQALNGKSLNDEVKNLVTSVAEPIKGLLSTTTNTTINNVEQNKKKTTDDKTTSDEPVKVDEEK